MATTYATISDVNALVAQSPYTASSTPTQAQVERFIAQVALRTDAVLKNLGYIIPISSVTAPDSFALVKEAVSWGALGLAQQARQTAVTANDATDVSLWTKMYLGWLDRLGSAKDPFELPDAERTGLAVVKPLGEIQSDLTELSDFTYNDDLNGTGPGPTFKIGMQF